MAKRSLPNLSRVSDEEARRLLEALSQDERRDLKDSMARRDQQTQQAERDW